LLLPSLTGLIAREQPPIRVDLGRAPELCESAKGVIEARERSGPLLTNGSKSTLLRPGSNGVQLAFIEPGKPVQNAYIDGFNRSAATSV
jgi:hypothetical protein